MYAHEYMIHECKSTCVCAVPCFSFQVRVSVPWTC